MVATAAPRITRPVCLWVSGECIGASEKVAERGETADERHDRRGRNRVEMAVEHAPDERAEPAEQQGQNKEPSSPGDDRQYDEPEQVVPRKAGGDGHQLERD